MSLEDLLEDRFIQLTIYLQLSQAPERAAVLFNISTSGGYAERTDLEETSSADAA